MNIEIKLLKTGILSIYEITWLFAPKDQQDAMKTAALNWHTWLDGASDVEEMSVQTDMETKNYWISVAFCGLFELTHRIIENMYCKF